ncbi:MAG: MAE_28990/MAE_18760 family HEPN-like nuclease [Marivibrio sp.]|uniref:MAE_28990/MAE_18760 family HEPN-like nuclease n=1 Tax=Marivibrio sp. TaxID=2039719 RepID=UPI0032EC0D9B
MNADERCELISEDWLWREKELRTMDYDDLRKKDIVDLKKTILVTYSHWEGHFKYCAELLLNYIAFCVKRKIVKWTDVKEELRLRIIFCCYRKSSLGNQNYDTFIKYLNAVGEQRFSDISDAQDAIIMTDDNLNTSRAESICKNLGVPSFWFSTKKVIIDERILTHRNAFAHGSRTLREGAEISWDDPDLWRSASELRSLIRQTKDQFQNAIQTKSFVE